MDLRPWEGTEPKSDNSANSNNTKEVEDKVTLLDLREQDENNTMEQQETRCEGMVTASTGKILLALQKEQI